MEVPKGFAARRRPLSKTSVLSLPKPRRLAVEPSVLLAPHSGQLKNLPDLNLRVNASSTVVTPAFARSSPLIMVIGEALCAATL